MAFLGGLGRGIRNLFKSDTVRGSAKGSFQGAAMGAPFGPYGAAAGSVLGGLTGAFSGHKGGKMGKKDKKALKKSLRAEKAYNKAMYSGRFGEKSYNKKLNEFYKKYGSEKHKKLGLLTGQQRSLLDFLSQQSREDIRNRREVPDITDIGNTAPYQQGLGSYQELLSENPQAFQRFAAPEMRRFQEQTIPGLVERFGAGGQNNSALNSALGNAGADLQERLGALRAGMQEQGRQGLLGYLGERERSQGLQAQNILNQQNLSQQGALGALRTNPYQIYNRGATAPNMILTGGPRPISYGPPTPREPGFFQQAFSSFAPAAGQAAGQSLGNNFSGNLGNFFQNSPPPQASNIFSMNQMHGH